MTELRFVAWQRPALPAGRYSVRVGQRLDVAGLDQAFGDVSAGAPLGGASLRFASHGPRVSLAPSAVVGRFPPPGSSGHDAEVHDRRTVFWDDDLQHLDLDTCSKHRTRRR